MRRNNPTKIQLLNEDYWLEKGKDSFGITENIKLLR